MIKKRLLLLSRLKKRRLLVILVGITSVLTIIGFAKNSSRSGYPEMDDRFYGALSRFGGANLNSVPAGFLGTGEVYPSAYLIDVIENPRGNTELYGIFYKKAPGWLRRRIAYPLLDDDIRMHALDDMMRLEPPSDEEFQQFISVASSLQNPRVQIRAMAVAELLMSKESRLEGGFLGAANGLLHEEDGGVRLRGAVTVLRCGEVDERLMMRAVDVICLALAEDEGVQSLAENQNYVFGGTAGLGNARAPGPFSRSWEYEWCLASVIMDSDARLWKLTESQRARFAHARTLGMERISNSALRDALFQSALMSEVSGAILGTNSPAIR